MNPVTSLPLPLPPIPPPPIPPPPLYPPEFALTGTDDLVLLPFLTETSFEVEDDAPDLRVVPPARNRAARAPFVTLVLALLGGGLVTLLLVNTALSQGAFAVQRLQKTNLALTEQRQELGQSLADANQPAALASKAVALGMMPGGAPAFLRLPDGKVMGSPKVAVPLPKPAPSVTAVVSAGPSVTGTPAPPTAGAPVTGAPVTSAPVAGAGVTSAAAVTSAPVTSAPVTSAPVTSAPVTSAPVTSAPVTSAAVTSAAHTSAPAVHSAAPPTGAAKTKAPGKTTPTKGKP